MVASSAIFPPSFPDGSLLFPVEQRLTCRLLQSPSRRAPLHLVIPASTIWMIHHHVFAAVVFSWCTSFPITSVKDTASKMEKSITDHISVFSVSTSLCYYAQTLTFLNKSSSNSSLEIKKTYRLQTGSKELDDSSTSCVVSTETPLRSGNPERSLHSVWCEFKDDLMIWCADMGETCIAAETESVPWDSTYTRWGHSKWTARAIISHSVHRPQLPDLAHKLTCELQKSIRCGAEAVFRCIIRLHIQKKGCVSSVDEKNWRDYIFQIGQPDLPRAITLSGVSQCVSIKNDETIS